MHLNHILRIFYYLDMKFPHRVPHKHGVEGGHLVHAHARHPDEVSDVVHGADRQPAAVLTLGQVEQWDHLHM